MLAPETVRVLPVREQDYTHVHSFGEDHIRTSESSVYSGLVAVVKDGEIRGEAAYEPDLLHSKRSAAGGNHIGEAQLLHSDYIHIALHQIALVLS